MHYSLVIHHHASPAQVALAWFLARQGVSGVSVGACKVINLEENRKAVDLFPSANDLKLLGVASDQGTPNPTWNGNVARCRRGSASGNPSSRALHRQRLLSGPPRQEVGRLNRTLTVKRSFALELAESQRWPPRAEKAYQGHAPNDLHSPKYVCYAFHQRVFTCSICVVT